MALLERPGSSFNLPSLGKPYGDLLPGGKINIYAMKTTEEKLFAGLNKPGDFENVMDTLITRCTDLPKELKPSDLYTGDRTFLMMYIRAVSYGVVYGFEAHCTGCGQKWDHSIDITKDLEVKEVTPDWEDPFEIQLPYSGDRVKLRLFRGDDERRVIKFVDRSTRKVNIRNAGDPGYIYRMALHVIGVTSDDPKRTFGGEDVDQAEILQDAQMWVEKLDAPDSSAIREELDIRTPGIILSVEYDCPKCGRDMTEPLPVSPSFFRSTPTSRVHTRSRAVPAAEW